MRQSTKAGLGITTLAALGTAYFLTQDTKQNTTYNPEKPAVVIQKKDTLTPTEKAELERLVDRTIDRLADGHRLPIERTQIKKYDGHVTEHFENRVLVGTSASYDENFTRADHARLGAIDWYHHNGIFSIHDLRELNDPEWIGYQGAFAPFCSFVDMQIYLPDGTRLQDKDMNYIMGRITREAWEAGRGKK